MPLDPSRLEKAKPTGDGGLIARCPACAAVEDGDSHGQHLRVFPDGAFACAAHPGDRDHRRQIWQLAGDRDAARGLPARVLLTRSRDDAWERAGRISKARILARPWSPEEIAAASPGPIQRTPWGQAMDLISLFRPRDIIWIGEEWHSGHQRHAHHFRRAADWLKAGILAGPRICPASFHPGVVARARRTVKVRRFLVVECDHLPHAQQGAIFRFLIDQLGLQLRAVVDTAGRSLHGWFDSPPPARLAGLRSFLPQLGADPALFNPAQPCRLPGWPRADTGRIPTLIYLAPCPRRSNDAPTMTPATSPPPRSLND